MLTLTTDFKATELTINDGEVIVYLHPRQSNEHYFALSGLFGLDKKTEKEKFEAMAEFSAQVIKGWSNDEFFGGKFSAEYVRFICSQIVNREFVNMVVSKSLESDDLKNGTPE